MKKWAVLNEIGMDIFINKFENKEEALEYVKNPLECQRGKVIAGLFEFDDDGEFDGTIWDVIYRKEEK